ncbi:amidase [Podospora australis]|uniref:Amidase n=1 Tax=Podospora australis TaxID=1536484 RepID=A0AAN6WXT0_9PEZI|nr:amidase [Podospora australis]
MPGPPGPLYLLTAGQALELLQNNAITVEKYARSLLQRINERDGTVKAWVHLDRQQVLEQSKTLDHIPQGQRGPLHGIAVGVKDVINTKDMPTQFGSPLYEGHQLGSDASTVAILRAAGALILGKTTTTEVSVTNSGPDTTSPHAPNRTPGGSSCGSAAALPAYQVPLSLGSQTGGSLIRPASFTRVFAMKPTHNVISPEGQKMVSPTFDTFGVMARSIEDLQLVADIFGLQDGNADDPQSATDIPLSDLSVAVVKSPMRHRAGPGTINAIKKAAAILKKSGCNVEEAVFPSSSSFPDEESLRRMQKVSMAGEARVAFLREYRIDKTKLDSSICKLVENSDNITHQEQAQALDTYGNLRAVADSSAAKYSVILTPSAVDEAPLGLHDMGSAAMNTLWTGLHMPVINIPAFVGAHGMPIEVSLVAGRFHDQGLIRVAKALSGPVVEEGG